MNIADKFFQTAKGLGNKDVFLVSYDKVINYYEEYTRYSAKESIYFSKCAYYGLGDFGIKTGDRIVLFPPNHPETYFTMIGLHTIGAVIVPINMYLLLEPQFSKIKEIILNSGAKVMIIPDYFKIAASEITKAIKEEKGVKIKILSFREILKEGENHIFNDVKNMENKFGHFSVGLARLFFYQPEIDASFNSHPDDIALILYTSGTGGQSKGVPLSHCNILERTTALSKALNASKNDKFISYLPWGHIFGLIATFYGQIVNGYTVCFMDAIKHIPFERDKFAKAFFKTLIEEKPTIFLGVPKVWENFKKEIEQKTEKSFLTSALKRCLYSLYTSMIRTKIFPKVRICITSSNKCPDSVKSFFEDLLGLTMTDIYGMTETAGPILINGKPVGNIEVKVNEEGEILVRGAGVMRGYLNPGGEMDKDVKIINKDGWFYTGDLGEVVDEKEIPIIKITERKKYLIKTDQGEYIAPLPMESELKLIQGVEEVCVIDNQGHNRILALIFCEEKFIEDKNFIEKIREKIQEINSNKRGMEQIKNFTVLSMGELQISNGLLTPTQKISKIKIKEKYADLIEKL